MNIAYYRAKYIAQAIAMLLPEQFKRTIYVVHHGFNIMLFSIDETITVDHTSRGKYALYNNHGMKKFHKYIDSNIKLFLINISNHFVVEISECSQHF